MKNASYYRTRNDESSSSVYRDAIQSFNADPVNMNTMWIKGEVVNPGKVATITKPTVDRLYVPTTKFNLPEQPSTEASVSLDGSLPEKPAKLDHKRDKTKKKKTNLEMFKDELKQMQEQREQRHQLKKYLKEVQEASEGTRKTRFDPAPPPVLLSVASAPVVSEFGLDIAGELAFDAELDRTSTNLFMGNLCPEITEQQLMELFGNYGPLASVKIMWPRTDEERKKLRNCGFVAYMCRSDAEKAMDRLKGRDIMGFEMKIGWGKPVAIPPYPVYIPPSLLETVKPPPVSGLPFNAQPMEWLKQKPVAHREPININRLSSEELRNRLKNSIIKVVIPSDRLTLCCINRMVEYVVREGHLFEALIMNRELENPQYRFLFDYNSPEHTYYRWKVYSILHGDTAQNWRQGDFRMYKNGPLWRPPPVNVFLAGMPDYLIEEGELPPMHPNAGSSGSPLSSRPMSPVVSFLLPNATDTSLLNTKRVKPGEKLLTSEDSQKLSSLLANLCNKRLSIAETMVWCLDHAESAQNIVDSICSRFDSMPDHDAATAHLFLISDLLHNSSAKVSNASHFRGQFEMRLAAIFLKLHGFLDSLVAPVVAARGPKDNFRQYVSSVVRAWEDWALYPRDFLIHLNSVFLGLTKSSSSSGSVNMVGAASNGAEALDGMPLVADYDGDPLDLDGEPLEFQSSGQRSHSVGNKRYERSDDNNKVLSGGSSRWERESSLEAVGVTGLVSYESGDSDTGSIHSDSDARISEERRSRLRDIELKVTKFQDDLESGRKRPTVGHSVHSEVQNYRQKLLQKDEQKSSSKLSSGSGGKSKKHNRQRSRSPARKHRHR